MNPSHCPTQADTRLEQATAFSCLWRKMQRASRYLFPA